jgi:hypothetical protein
LFLDGGVSKIGVPKKHKLFIASFRIRKDFVKACSKTSPSASEVFWAGGAGRIQSKISGRSLVAVPLKTIVEIRFKAGIVVVLKRND